MRASDSVIDARAAWVIFVNIRRVMIVQRAACSAPSAGDLKKIWMRREIPPPTSIPMTQKR